MWQALDSGEKTSKDPDVVDEILDDAGVGKRHKKIRCPKCAWQPRKQDRWWCNRPGCGHSWNTFDTRGVCPGCHYQWEWTACLKCHVFSRHAEWYEGEDDDGILRK